MIDTALNSKKLGIGPEGKQTYVGLAHLSMVKEKECQSQ